MSTNRTRKPASSIPTAYGGGINPQGEIEISFYLESDKMPPYSERIIAPDGSFGHEIAPYNDEERTITRHHHSRVS